MMTETVLRTATAGDVAEMWRVRTAAIRAVSDNFYPTATTQYWASVEMPQDFADAFDVIDAIVCIHRSTLVGWGFANLNVSHIDALFVDPSWQRKGFGAKIMQRFEELATYRQLEKLELSSTLNAVAFYQRLGFESLGQIAFNHANGFTLPSKRMIKRFRRP